MNLILTNTHAFLILEHFFSILTNLFPMKCCFANIDKSYKNKSDYRIEIKNQVHAILEK